MQQAQDGRDQIEASEQRQNPRYFPCDFLKEHSILLPSEMTRNPQLRNRFWLILMLYPHILILSISVKQKGGCLEEDNPA